MVSRNTPGSAFNILIYVGKSVKTKSTTSIRMSMGAYARSTSVRMVSVQPILRAIVNALLQPWYSIRQLSRYPRWVLRNDQRRSI